MTRALPAAAAVAAVCGAALLGGAVAVLALGRLPDDRAAVLAGLAGCLAAALLAVPLLRGAGTWSSRVLRGTRRSPQEVLRAFGDRASRGVPVDEQLRLLAESLRRALHADRVSVWTGDGEALERSVQVPAGPSTSRLEPAEVALLARVTVAGEQWVRTWLPGRLPEAPGLRVVPALHDGRVLGLLVVEGVRVPDDPALLDLGSRLGAVLSSRVLDEALQSTLDDLRHVNAELRASRARLVAAADAERRRLERDLHDGAQQHLVAVAVTLSLAGQILADDPAGAAELVEAAREQAQQAVAELRDLAHGLYPPVLAESGLEQALRAAAVRMRGDVRVELDGIGRAAAEVEAAVYFCCLEALANAAKHAAGAPVRVVGQVVDGRLRVEVHDGGPGIVPRQRAEGPAQLPGQGLANVRDRMGAVGGTAAWTSGPTGTTVRLEVPLRPQATVPAGGPP